MAYNLIGYNVILGTAAAEALGGGNLNDAIYGNGGADRIGGGIGADVLFGGLDGGVTFLSSIDGVWGDGYRVVNAGDPLGAGPGTTWSLAGYGQSQDVFVGSGVDNTVEIADGRNALFLEDALALGVDSIRLVDVHTIRLGSGGQIVDLTSSTIYGAVSIVGGSGDDIILSNAGADALNGGGGADYIWGGSGADHLSGDDGADQLFGATGDDLIDGGTGADTMTGGVGNDSYFVDDMGDVVVEASNGGTDTVNAALSYSLGANVENLVLIGAAAISGVGNALNNSLVGNAAANTLDGGAGRDTLAGGLGDDVYIVDNGADAIVEAADEGVDIAHASVSFTLSAEVENLTLTGAGNISGTGNALANVITGNGGNNTLTGGGGSDWIDGGAGRDTMAGGAGHDTFIVDHGNDAVVELAGEGTDLVYSSFSHTLAANVENLTLTGAANLSGTGNALNNVIIGNGGVNALSGLDGDDKIMGGDGADTILGGAGKDYLYGEYGNDKLDGGDGDDQLNGGADFDTLRGGAGNDGLFGGGANDFLFGEAGADTIYGDNGNDRITGGAGNDRLAGGQLKNGFSLGRDTFIWARLDVVDAGGVVQGFDAVLDFMAGDILDFSGLGLAGPASTHVRVIDSSAGSIVSADFGGAAGFVDVVLLEGVHGLTVDAMSSSGALVL